jgi:hypothetical protein
MRPIEKAMYAVALLYYLGTLYLNLVPTTWLVLILQLAVFSLAFYMEGLRLHQLPMIFGAFIHSWYFMMFHAG